jgi:hypothetical protein
MDAVCKKNQQDAHFFINDLIQLFNSIDTAQYQTHPVSD